MRTLVLLLLLATLAPVVPTADAYACAFDVEDPERSIRCETTRTLRCLQGFLDDGSLACPA